MGEEYTVSATLCDQGCLRGRCPGRQAKGVKPWLAAAVPWEIPAKVRLAHLVNKAQRERAQRERAQRERAQRERAQRERAQRERAQREWKEKEKKNAVWGRASIGAFTDSKSHSAEG